MFKVLRPGYSVHVDVIKWKHFLRYWPFVRGIHRWIPRTKASDVELDVFFDLCLNKQLSKQSWGWWLEMPSCPLWRHCNEKYVDDILDMWMFLLSVRVNLNNCGKWYKMQIYIIILSDIDLTQSFDKRNMIDTFHTITHCALRCHMVTYISVSIGSGNSLLPDGTKTLSKPVLTHHYWCSVAFTWEQFHGRWPSCVMSLKVIFLKLLNISQGPKS